MRLPSLSYLFNSWLGAARRFPLATTTALIATVCGIILIEDTLEETNQEAVFSLLLTCFLFFPLFITAVAAKESYDYSLGGHLITNVILVGAMIAYWKFYAPEINDYQFIRVVRFFLFVSTAHLLVTFIPFLKKSDLNDFWEYNRQLFIQFFTGMLYSILIYAGLSFALLAVKYLFDIDFDDKIFAHLFVATSGLFHTSYFLSNFPRESQFSIEKENFNRGFVNLIKFVFISMVTLYFIILYSYGIKILIIWNLPKGWVSSLVIGFSVIGILTYLLNYLLPEIEGSGWVKIFRKYFFYILPAVVVLLFIAIGKRVGDYGITEERYFVLLTGIWLAGISLYFIFSKKDDIRAIPITLAVGCMIAAVGGPLNAFSISSKSQKNRLEALLIDKGILKEGKIKKAEPQIVGEESDEIYSIVNYLSRNQHLDALSGWLPVDSLLSNKKSSWANTTTILNKLGVSNNNGNRLSKRKYRRFNSYHPEPVDVKNYDFYTEFHIRPNRDSYGKKPVPKFRFIKAEDNQSIIFLNGEMPLDTLNLNQLMNILNSEFSEDNNVPIQQMSHLHNSDRYSFLLTFDNIQFEIIEEVNTLKRANGNIFWKEK